MSEENNSPPQSKIWDIEDMPIERDGIRIFGDIYYFSSPSDISGQDIAEIMRFETRISQLQAQQKPAPNTPTPAEQQRQHVENLFNLLKTRTRKILVSTITDEILDKLSMRHHEYICLSFWQASNAAGEQPQEAPATDQPPASKTSTGE